MLMHLDDQQAETFPIIEAFQPKPSQSHEKPMFTGDQQIACAIVFGIASTIITLSSLVVAILQLRHMERETRS